MALTVDDLAKFLNINLTDADPRRPELDEHLRSAVALTEARTGPIYTRDVTYSVRSISGLLVIPATRLKALAGIVGPAGVVDLTLIPATHLDLHAGLIYLPAGYPDGPYAVTVTAGTDAPPADLTRAVLYVAGHLWDSQRGRTARPGVLGEDRTGAPAWAIPYAAESLMAPYLLPVDARSV